VAADLAEVHGIPFVFTPNVLDTSATGSAWATHQFHQLYGRATRLIALTDHEARWLVAQGVDTQKISVVPYGPVLQARSSIQESGNMLNILNSRFILFLGRLVPEKGYQTLLSSFEALAASDADTQLVLVGPAEDSICSLVKSLNEKLGQARVHLLQDISQPLKTALLEDAAVLCVPSKRESLGGVYIEAMASGTPVVALNRPVSRCVISNEVDGLLVENSAEGVSKALKRLIDNPELARNMGLAGQQKVAEKYAWPVVTKKILSVYDEAGLQLTLKSARAA